MNSFFIKKLYKIIVFGILYSAVLCIIAYFIKDYFNISFRDLLFIEGIISLILSLTSSISGNSMGLALGAMGRSNSQYITNLNLEAHKFEREKTNRDFININFNLVSISVILGSLVCIIGSIVI